AGTCREHRVEGGGGLVVLLEREQAERAEFVDRGITGQSLEGLVGLLQRLGVVAGLERGTGRIKRLHRRVAGRRIRRCRAGVQRLRIVDRSCLDHGRGLLHQHGLLDNHGRRDRLLDHDRLGDKVRVHIRPVAPVVNGRANSPGPDAANGKPRHERAAVVPPVAAVLAVPVAVDPALVIRPAGPVRPVRVAVGPARPVHVHIVDVVVDVIDREVVSGIDGTTGPVDPDVDVVRGVPRIVADTGAVDCGVPRIVANTRAIDCGVPRIVANTGAVDCGVPRIVADTRAIDRGVTRVVADAGTVDRGVTRVVADAGTVDRGVTRVVADAGTVDRGVTRVVAETGTVDRGVTR